MRGIPLCPICAEAGLTEEFGGAQATRDGMADHVALIHHLAARWPEETPEAAYARLLRLRPELASCDHCIAAGAPWANP